MASLAGRLHELGFEEIALDDTIGAGTPLTACGLVEATAHQVIAVHFHDTRGQAPANLLARLGLARVRGLSIIHAAVAGLGGCPYVPGVSGNVDRGRGLSARGRG